MDQPRSAVNSPATPIVDNPSTPAIRIRRETLNPRPDSEHSSARGLYAGVLLIALLSRAWWGWLVPVKLVSDCNAYDVFARNLAAGHSYGWTPETPGAFWPVGTSFMYSLVYRLFHPDTWGYAPAIVLNALLGLCTVALTMALARRWFGRAVALTAGLLLAIWPMHVQFTTVIASETVFTALCLAGMLAWPQMSMRASPTRDVAQTRKHLAARLILAGLFFAAATYVRPTALLIPVVLAGVDFLRSRRLLMPAFRCGVVLLVMAAAIAPWSVRNTRLFDRFVLISANGGSNLWMGNNPKTNGFYMEPPPRPEHLNEAQYDAQLGAEAKKYILSHPIAFALRTAKKAVLLHDRETIGVAWNPALHDAMPKQAILSLKIGGQVFWVTVLFCSLCGTIIIALRRGLWTLLTHPAVAIWAYFTAVHAVIVIQDRYHFPATPMIAALAALALVHAWTWAEPYLPGARVKAQLESPA